PDRLTLPASPAVAALLAIAAVAGGDTASFERAMLGGAALAVCYLIFGLVSGGQLGGGDVKLAGLIGLVLGWLGWGTLMLGAAAGFVLAALAGGALLAPRQAARRTAIRSGPAMPWGAALA